MSHLGTYYRRRIVLGMTAMEASYQTTERRRGWVREAMRRYRAKWGQPGRNAVDRHLQEVAREHGLSNREEARQWVATNGL